MSNNLPGSANTVQTTIVEQNTENICERLSTHSQTQKRRQQLLDAIKQIGFLKTDGKQKLLMKSNQSKDSMGLTQQRIIEHSSWENSSPSTNKMRLPDDDAVISSPPPFERASPVSDPSLYDKQGTNLSNAPPLSITSLDIPLWSLNVEDPLVLMRQEIEEWKKEIKKIVLG